MNWWDQDECEVEGAHCKGRINKLVWYKCWFSVMKNGVFYSSDLMKICDNFKIIANDDIQYLSVIDCVWYSSTDREVPGAFFI